MRTNQLLLRRLWIIGDLVDAAVGPAKMLPGVAVWHAPERPDQFDTRLKQLPASLLNVFNQKAARGHIVRKAAIRPVRPEDLYQVHIREPKDHKILFFMHYW